MIKTEATAITKGIVPMDEHILFTIALGVSKLWQVVDLKFSKEDGRLDLWLDFQKGAKFRCPFWSETKEATKQDIFEQLVGMSVSSNFEIIKQIHAIRRVVESITIQG
jgi:hypothetical protein